MSEEPKSSTKYVMVESDPSTDENEIDLLKLIRTLLAAWQTIALATPPKTHAELAIQTMKAD